MKQSYAYRAIAVGLVLGLTAGCPRPESSTGTDGGTAGLRLAFTTTVSGANALPEACQSRHSESQPQLVVHPDNPRLLDAVYFQDGIQAVVAARSTDGGASWVRTPVSDATQCAGGSPEREVTVNPLLSAGAEGATYFGNSWVGSSGTGVTLHDFRDDGAGVSPAGDTAQNLSPLADPLDANKVDAIWTHFDAIRTPFGSLPAQSALYASQSADAGRSFRSAAVAADADPGRLIINGRLVRDSHGALLAVYDSAAISDMPNSFTGARTEFALHAVRSSDDGVNWTAPVSAGPVVFLPLADPEGVSTPGAGDGAIAGSYKFDVATGPAGLVVAVHADRFEDGRGRLMLTRSTDGGRSWLAPFDAIVRSSAVFMPAIAIDSVGRIGLFWYDWTTDQPGDAALSTDAWFAQSADGGETWAITHLAGPFDLRAAYEEGIPYDGGALGVYQDLIALPDGFGAAFTVGPPLAADGRADIWFARLTQGAD